MRRTRRESKPTWAEVPATLRRRLERKLGCAVVDAMRAYGGYGPSATFRLALADGRRVFFKGIYPVPSESGARWSLQEEMLVYRRLRRYIFPWAPAYLGSFHSDGWHALLLEDVGGRGILPWTAAKARRAVRSYAEFHRSTYGQRLPAWLSREQHYDFAQYWSRLSEEEGALDRVAALAGEELPSARKWLAENVPALAGAERELAVAGGPYVLLHFDTRSDNIRLQGDLLRIFDWPFASIGPHEFDLAAFAQSIESEGGPRSEDVVDWYIDILPVRPSLLTASIVGIAGYFADRAPRPTVEGLPRLRSVQRQQLKASLSWAARALRLQTPLWLAGVPD
jgi:thiamine kinase-like enzyme